MPGKFLNILALLTTVFLACSFSPTFVTALSIDSNGFHDRHAQIDYTFAKRATRRCKPSSPAGGDPSTPASIPTVTPANPSNTPATTPPPPAASPMPNGTAGLAYAYWETGGSLVLERFQRLSKVSGVYTWDYKFEGAKNFIPMCWGEKKFSDWRTYVLNTFVTHALGFNEPDLPQQANMDPTFAAKMWHELMTPLRIINPDVTLISPAVTSSPSGEAWFDEFSAQCADCFNAIAVHWYGRRYQDFIAYLQRWHDKYGKPLWVTEFACVGSDTPCDETEVLYFAGNVTHFMDNSEWVHFYSPFVVSNDLRGVDEGNRLVDQNLQPTDVAHIYFGY